MLSTTTLQIAFDKTSPNPTQDRLRVLKRKGVKKSKKRVRFAESPPFDYFRTGHTDPSNTGASPHHYEEGDAEKGATMRKQDLKPKNPTTLKPDIKPKDPTNPTGYKLKDPASDKTQDPSIGPPREPQRGYSFPNWVIFILIGILGSILVWEIYEYISRRISRTGSPPGGPASVNMLNTSRNPTFHMLPPAEVYSLFG